MFDVIPLIPLLARILRISERLLNRKGVVFRRNNAKPQTILQS